MRSFLVVRLLEFLLIPKKKPFVSKFLLAFLLISRSVKNREFHLSSSLHVADIFFVFFSMVKFFDCNFHFLLVLSLPCFLRIFLMQSLF